jgi:predicted ester cyclase
MFGGAATVAWVALAGLRHGHHERRRRGNDERYATPGRWAIHEAYSAGDSDGLLASLSNDWVLHEEDGGTSSRADLAEITLSHAGAFPEKEIEWLHELVDGNRVAHYVRFVLVHSGRYGDLDPPGKRVQLWEMIFHRFDGDVIAESWRMTYPDSVYSLLSAP